MGEFDRTIDCCLLIDSPVHLGKNQEMWGRVLTQGGEPLKPVLT